MRLTRPHAASPVVLFLGLLALGGLAHPVAAQFDVGVGIGVANTDQNAVSLGGSMAWHLGAGLALRGIGDAELAVPDFREGLVYRGTDRVWIDDEFGHEQRPKDNDLWENEGWDAHAAIYATAEVLWWRLHVGPGYAYNGLDRTWGKAFAVVLYLTARTELDVEFLDPVFNPTDFLSSLRHGRWRGRLSLNFWNF